MTLLGSFAMGAIPDSLAVDPTGCCLYAANVGSDSVLAFTIDVTTGVLTAIPNLPFPAGQSPRAVTIDSTGRFVWVANGGSDDISTWRIDESTRASAAIPGTPLPAAVGPRWLTTDPAGRFLYVANGTRETLGSISACAIDATPGVLTPIPGSPLPVGAEPFAVTTTGGTP